MTEPGTSTEVRLPAAWIGTATGLAVAAWVAVVVLGSRSTPWLGITLGIALGLTLFAIGSWAQRVRVEGERLSGNVLLRRSVDLTTVTRIRVGGNPMSGGARSNDVAIVEDANGGRVTIPLRTFPADRRREIAAILRGPALSCDAELDDDARAFLDDA